MLSFHVKFVQTDRRTMVKQYAPSSPPPPPPPPPIFRYGGIKMIQKESWENVTEGADQDLSAQKLLVIGSV